MSDGLSARSGQWSRVGAHHGKQGGTSRSQRTSERRVRVQVRQGQGVTKAKGERQLEPRHLGPGTGKVLPQMPGYLAQDPTSGAVVRGPCANARRNLYEMT